jgi:gliding motility-associated protein GldM
MAGGKQTPRQKMINMMYLVLTALLALNVSKEILDAFVKVNESMQISVDKMQDQTSNIYAQFAAAVQENPQKATEWNNKALEVKKSSDELYSYIETVKDEMITLAGGMNEDGEYPKMDNKSIPANYLLVEGNGRVGKELTANIDAYRQKVTEMIQKENPVLVESINKVFDTSPQKVGDMKNVPWAKAQFEHYPLMAIITFMTKIQSDIRATELDVISELQKNIGKYDVKVNKMDAVAMVPSSYVFTGDTFTAEIFIAAFDTTQTPTVKIYNEYDEDGNPIGDAIEVPVVDGRGQYVVPANSEGTFTWGGVVEVITPKGLQEFQVDPRTYQVAQGVAVISPTAMNVLYRGVDNPIEVSVPGVSPDDLNVTCSGCSISGSRGKFVAKAGNGNEAKINVSANGKQIGQMDFRIKRIPPPMPLIAGRDGGTISKSALAGTQGVAAILQDFPFDIQYRVSSFTVRAQSGEYVQTVKVKGNAFNKEVKDLINGMKPGSDVSFTEIRATGPDGVKNCPAIVFTVQ